MAYIGQKGGIAMESRGKRLALGTAAAAIAIAGGAALAQSWNRQAAGQAHASFVTQGSGESYGYMMGGSAAPGWEQGGSLPGYMMGGSGSPGEIMGRQFANGPGPRISSSAASTAAQAVPSGARIDRARRTVTFSTTQVHLNVVATMTGSTDGFEVAGMSNPSIVVPRNSTLEISFVNADQDMAHGLAIVPQGAGNSEVPMMTAGPAFTGAAVWFLGDATASSAPEQTISFSADHVGTYQYICPVLGHALAGMQGELIVS